MHLFSKGFDGVETPVALVEDKSAFAAALKKHDLFYIAMINTCTFPPDDCKTASPEDHLASFKRLVGEAKLLSPILINSHSGCDSWSYTQHFTTQHNTIRINPRCK
jgi:hypothetical protein